MHDLKVLFFNSKYHANILAKKAITSPPIVFRRKPHSLQVIISSFLKIGDWTPLQVSVQLLVGRTLSLQNKTKSSLIIPQLQIVLLALVVIEVW